jgi:hypothetical protein
LAADSINSAFGKTSQYFSDPFSASVPHRGDLYEMLYPDFLRDPSGNVTLITITEGSYPNPIYRFEVIADGDFAPTLAEPGEELELKGLRFAFNKPVEYPGLRIKHVSTVFNALLIASFTMMIAGLCITFFFEPVLVRTDAEGYAVGGPKPERMRIDWERNSAHTSGKMRRKQHESFVLYGVCTLRCGCHPGVYGNGV